MEEDLNLTALLEKDGQYILKRIVDFLAKSFVDLSEGGCFSEMHELTENVDVFLIIKRRKNGGNN